jgi:phospholipid/cholesterol/gamma-HCH transport system substrate-binding protein
VKRVALLIVAALGLAACNLSIGSTQLVGIPPSYIVSAQFPSTIGLYPGSFVRQLGIDVGQVSKVANQSNDVLVTMKIQNKYHLAQNATAILVGDSVLGERYVQFEPAYVGGTPMAPGTTLGPDRVAVPVETDAVLRSLNSVLRQINPTDVRNFTVNVATVLQGQGTKLNALIANAAGTVKVLADKGNQLGQLDSTLAQLTGQLSTRDQELARLISDYDLLSQTLAADRGQLDGTITQLTNVTTQASALLAPNLTPIQQDVADLATVGQTLDRNLPAVDSGLKYADRLFSAAKSAYDPMHDWLPLNSQANPTETSAVLGASVRDSLASLCRRLAMKEPALASTLSSCGDPTSGFFNAIIGLAPTILKNLPGQIGPATGTATGSASGAFSAGVAAIPGLSSSQRSALSAGVSASPGPDPAPAGPPGAAAVAALSAAPLGPVVSAAHTAHGRGVMGGLLHWIGGLL